METSTGSRTRNRNDRMHSHAVQELRSQAATVKKDAWHLAETAGTVAREQLDPLVKYVTDKPIQSLVIAGCVGMVFGFIFSRR